MSGRAKFFFRHFQYNFRPTKSKFQNRPERTQNQQKIEVGYFKKWLLSLGNKRALAFEQSIDANNKRLLDLKSKIFQINSQFLQLLKLTDVNSIDYNTKHYIEKLDKNTKNYILRF